ncbi:MAG: glycosyltransferase [Candidatus Helarchaeota archaeon]
MIKKMKNRISEEFNKIYNTLKEKMYNLIFPSFISLKTKKNYRGNVLLSYLVPKCLFNKGQGVSLTHSNEWECLQIAKIFLDLGYDVDIIRWTDKKFVPKKKYSFFIDIHHNMERLAPILNKECVKIFHITGSHWHFQNTAEYYRLLALKKRRGVILIPRRMVTPNLAIEYCDYATILGNNATMETYAFAKKTLFKIPLSTTVLYEFNENKDIDKCKRNFLWLGSKGMVHKGLDLVLEVFRDLPNHKLIVCGKISEEKDFEREFHRELYETPNIITVGWVDINSQLFLKIINNCIGLIYPSSSEGQAGSVVTCLHAGLIPIISYHSGVDVNNFGIILKDNSHEEIKNSILKLSNLPSRELKIKSRKAWEYARANHTREKFREEYKKFVMNILMKN